MAGLLDNIETWYPDFFSLFLWQLTIRHHKESRFYILNLKINFIFCTLLGWIQFWWASGQWHSYFQDGQRGLGSQPRNVKETLHQEWHGSLSRRLGHSKGSFQKLKQRNIWNFPYVGCPPPPYQHMENSFVIFYCLKRISDSFWDFFIFSP